jgi:hypothetical protein
MIRALEFAQSIMRRFDVYSGRHIRQKSLEQKYMLNTYFPSFFAKPIAHRE